ncbi:MULTISPECIES: glycosyltransferase [Sphingomonas]|uniref:glycosyltransferase n=1 Tax=Sphingomonas TaxID=13687 RepID=UPI00082EAD8E|nr:glycosyltransferase [Sphingomonas sp. CCH10-B3]
MIWIGGVALAVWLVLVFARDGFWLTRERDTADLPPPPVVWPSVVAVVPARDEAEVIARSIGSLIAQDYPGDFRVVLVDDNSSDGTAEIARGVAEAAKALSPSPSGEGYGVGRFGLTETEDPEARPHPLPSPEGEGLSNASRLSIISGAPLAPGWTGKLWAVHQGIAAAGAADYLWLTDADIAHAPDTLTTLVTRAVGDDRVLVTLMARLRCESLAERALIPAFVWFFAMLYPFAAVNRATGIGGAAGGCMLARRDALEAAGGIAAVRNALIDDCAFGALMKRQGRVWLGLTDRSVSIRRYETWGSVGAMISRSAYAQLRYSPVLLAGTLVGLALIYLAPVLLTLFGEGYARGLGLAAWVLMTIAFQPMLRFYRRSPLWGVALPAIALFYAAQTFASAWAHWRGRGGMWKGRAQAAIGA